MKRHWIGLLVFGLGWGFSAVPDAAAQPGPEGTWLGTLSLPGQRLRIVFHIEAAPEGWTATLDSPDQGATGIPAGPVTFSGDTLRIAVPRVQGMYEGRFDAAGAVFEGTWRQGGFTLPLVLERTDDTLAVVRPQVPEPPFPYQAEEVTFENEADAVRLAGTLTLPLGEGPHPAVVLISGSGPQDRNGTLFGHQPFWVLADALTRRGIAVLRYDERGVGASGGTFETATSTDFARDVAAAVDYLKTRPAVEPARVGLVGHSEGGLIAPMVAADRDDVAFVVLLAGPGVPGEEILYQQGARIAQAAGADEATLEAQRRQQEQLFAVVKQEPDDTAARMKLEALLRAALAEQGLDEAALVAQLQAQSRQLTSPWFRYFLTYDPAAALRALKVPVLALFGEKDLQVPAESNRAAMEAALQAGGHTVYRIEVLPGLNHLFQTAGTGHPAEYGQIEETMAPVVPERIAVWIEALQF